MLTETDLIPFEPSKFDATLIEHTYNNVSTRFELWKLGNRFGNAMVLKVGPTAVLLNSGDVVIYEYDYPLVGDYTFSVGHFSYTSKKFTWFDEQENIYPNDYIKRFLKKVARTTSCKFSENQSDIR